MIKSVCSFSSQGSRPSQEDYLLSNREKNIFVVADGFGGPTPGLTAARTACESIRNFLIKEAGDRDATLPFVLRTYFSLAGNVLFNAVLYANRMLLSLNQGKTAQEKGGASMLAGYVDGDLLALANVGACSAWLFRDDEVAELVIPRTYGRLVNPLDWRTPDLDRTPLTAAGMSEDLEPEIFEYKVQENDWILLQTSTLAPETIVELQSLRKLGLSADDAAHEVSALFERGNYKNNTTVSLVIF